MIRIEDYCLKWTGQRVLIFSVIHPLLEIEIGHGVMNPHQCFQEQALLFIIQNTQ